MSARALAGLRRRPRHVGLAALVVGLALGPRWPPGVLLAALGGAALAPAPPAGLLIALLALAGGWMGQARMQAVPAPAPALFGHALADTAEVLDAPARSPWGGWRATVRLRGRAGGAHLLLHAPRGVPPPPAGEGALLAVRGGLRALRPRERYLRARGVRGALDAEVVRDTGAVRGGPQGAVDALRRRVARALTTGLPHAEGALLLGMVLGDASQLPAGDAAALREAGLTHLVAASGANIALLAALVAAAGAAVGLPRRGRLIAALAAIAVYVPLAGAGPSIQRAGVMGAAAVLAALAGRPAARWYAVLLAAAVTLALTPGALQDAGWQMSFAAAVAIMALAAPLGRRLTARGIPGPAAAALAVTLAATAASAPLIAWHFGRISPVTLPANVLAAAAAAPVMWLGVLAGLAEPWCAPLAHVLAQAAAVPAAFILLVGRASARVDGALGTAGAALALIGLGAAGGTVAWARRPARAGEPRRAPVAAVVLVLTLLVWGALRLAAPGAPAAAPDAFQVAFLDVGQGDATLLRHGADAVLVDTGPPGGPVLARLRALGVRHLDALVITHAQADHDGGAAAVLGALPVGVLLDGRDGVRDGQGARAAAVAARRGVRRVVPTAGMRLRAGPIVLHVLSPPAAPPGAHAGEDPNDRAVVALARDGPTRVLLTADAESPVTGGLVTGPVDILKVAHHGSADDGLVAQLASLRPRVAGIEVGARNPYGHPVPATLRALGAVAGAVVRTDRDGTVLVTRRGARLVLRRHAG